MTNILYLLKLFFKDYILNTDAKILFQIFGTRAKYYLLHPNEISLIQLCEIDRLNNKMHGLSEYEPIFIDLPFYNKAVKDISEQTTVTKKERRVFDLDIYKLKNNCRVNNPYIIYLNFFEQLDVEYEHNVGNYNNFYFNKYLREYMNWLETNTNTDILALDTGAKNNERILKKSLIKR